MNRTTHPVTNMRLPPDIAVLRLKPRMPLMSCVAHSFSAYNERTGRLDHILRGENAKTVGTIVKLEKACLVFVEPAGKTVKGGISSPEADEEREVVGECKAISGKADYDVGSGAVILTEAPFLLMDGSILKCEKITVHSGDRIILEGVKEWSKAASAPEERKGIGSFRGNATVSPRQNRETTRFHLNKWCNRLLGNIRRAYGV